MPELDQTVERLSRWAAAHFTRRSFLGNLGRGAVLVAGGPGIAVLLADEAEARVCGQSGVAPTCATFDCDATWGWCWYASGCCADGALKKICDCCAPNTPHPVGYCPSGTRVKCLVESCGADPRLQQREIVRWSDPDPDALTVAISQRAFPLGAAMAVIGNAGSHAAAAAAASLSGVVEGPVLLSAPDGPSDSVRRELGRLGTEFAVAVGMPGDVAIPGVVIEHLPVVGEAISGVAAWSRAMTGARTAVVVTPDAPPAGLASGAALASARRWPLLIGDRRSLDRMLRVPRAVQRTFVVTADPAQADDFPGGVPVWGAQPGQLAARAADVAVGRAGVARTTVALAPSDRDLAAVALASLGLPLLRYEPGTLDGSRDWLFAHRPAITTALVAGTPEEFGDEPYTELQSILNEFETHLLIGGPGDGLPVISQPRDERPIGKARR